MKKTLAFILLSWMAGALLSTIPSVRVMLTLPLAISHPNARGDACYVMAGGNALWERLAAASDLYFMNRISKIMLMRNSDRGPYNFPARASWTQTQWAISYLQWRGVPTSSVAIIDQVDGPMGTLAEAKNVAQRLPPGIKRLVLVSSAPHMRRTLLAFRKTLPSHITAIPFASTSIESSAEYYDPIWLEYLKLTAYKIILLF